MRSLATEISTAAREESRSSLIAALRSLWSGLAEQDAGWAPLAYVDMDRTAEGQKCLLNQGQLSTIKHLSSHQISCCLDWHDAHRPIRMPCLYEYDAPPDDAHEYTDADQPQGHRYTRTMQSDRCTHFNGPIDTITQYTIQSPSPLTWPPSQPATRPAPTWHSSPDPSSDPTPCPPRARGSAVRPP